MLPEWSHVSEVGEGPSRIVRTACPSVPANNLARCSPSGEFLLLLDHVSFAEVYFHSHTSFLSTYVMRENAT